MTPTCRDVRRGAIGVAFNDGCVTVSETDRFGNLIAHQDIPMVTAGLSKHAAQTTITAAVQEMNRDRVQGARKPISIEFIDFAKKKAPLSYASPGRQRMLSAFAINRFAQTLGARARDAGHAAALVLARRGRRFPDRLKSSSGKRCATTSKDRGEPCPKRASRLVA